MKFNYNKNNAEFLVFCIFGGQMTPQKWRQNYFFFSIMRYLMAVSERTCYKDLKAEIG